MASLGAKEVYKYGFYGLSLDHVAKYSSFGIHLTEPQRQAIYNVGRQARERQINAATPKVATKQRGIYFDQGNGKVVSLKDADKTLLSEKKKSAGVQAAIVLHKLGIGGDIYFFESYRNSKGQLVYKNSLKPNASAFFLSLAFRLIRWGMSGSSVVFCNLRWIPNKV